MAHFLDCTISEIWIRGSDFLAPSLTTWHLLIFFIAEDSCRHTWFLGFNADQKVITYMEFFPPEQESQTSHATSVFLFLIKYPICY